MFTKVRTSPISAFDISYIKYKLFFHVAGLEKI